MLFQTTVKRKKHFSTYNDTKHIKYKMGGTGQNGIDCSAFTQKCLERSLIMYYQDQQQLKFMRELKLKNQIYNLEI